MVRNKQGTWHQWIKGALLMLEETLPKNRVVGFFSSFLFGFFLPVLYRRNLTHTEKRGQLSLIA